VAKKSFNGIIRLDVRDSIPDWEPYLAPKAPAGAPNILFVLFDDTGLAAWEPFGGKIQMPTLKKIADQGLKYTQWHTAALCSPTRGMLLTGRNHHLNGNASITEGANGFPGQHARMPDECATVAQLLQDAGWSTFWVGKNHNVPETDLGAGSTKKQWPLAKGFDRFYGFIGGETNQFYPDLTADNHTVEQPYLPEDGYHLSRDLADQAIQMIKDQQASNPSKPWYMWFCPGANHAPHQIPEGWLNGEGAHYNYVGMFDEGYEQYRDDVLPTMKALDIVPAETVLTDLNPMFEKVNADNVSVENADDEVRPWQDVGDVDYPNAGATERELFAKMMEVYAAFSTYTDEQVGRIYDYLEATDQLENTLIVYAADNGASGEGSPFGTVNENKFFNGYKDSTQENMATVADINGLENLGGPDTYEHYPTGWAAATSTPFKMFKRYSQYAGGTCDPLVMSWPKRITEAVHGQVRHQYHHCVDIVPTILEACGLEMPEVYRGVKQYPLSGVSMCYTWDAQPDAPTKKLRQYYAMLGTRAIWENGWKAVALHAPLSGLGQFDKDVWELYHVDVDRSESNNLMVEPPTEEFTAEQRTKKLQQLIDAWFEEAEKNLVLPLDDRSAIEQVTIERPTEEAPRDSYIYYPGTASVPESVAVNIRGRSYCIEADVTIGDDCEGVIFAHGSRFGGHSLFMQGMKVWYVYNFLGIKDELSEFTSDELLPGRYTFVVKFAKREELGEHDESVGMTTLSVKKKDEIEGDYKIVSVDGPRGMKAQTGKFTLCGDGLCVGYDSADAISDRYEEAYPFTKGTIHSVTITPSGDVQVNSRLFAAAFSVD
jgi:arylsulfatase